MEYELTEFGRTLEPVLLMLRDWGATHLDALRPSDRATAALNPCKPDAGAGHARA